MKNRTSFLTILMVAVAVLLTNSGVAFAADNKKKCKKPRFYQFKPVPSSPPPEVSPGSQVEFRASGVTEPRSVELSVKKIKVDLEMEDRNIFYIYRGNLPAELSGTFARISIRGKSKLPVGACSKRDGWLVKISEGGGSTETGADQEGKKEAKTVENKSL